MDFLISFDDLKAGGKALNKLRQAFTRAGAPVATADIDARTKRTSGVNYREVKMTFTDNQSVTLGVKTTGDIFEVKVNGSVVPIKNQGDQRKAVGEIVKALDFGRAKHQAKMARQKAALPKGITTAAPRMEQKIAEAQASLDERIAAVKAEIVELKTELGEVVMDGARASAPTDLEEVYIRGEKGAFYISRADKIKDARFIPVRDSKGKKIKGMEVHQDNIHPSQEKADQASAKIRKGWGLDSVHTVAGEQFDGGELDNLYAFARRGKLEDGDIPAKGSRDTLVERGFVERGDGMNWLTDKGKDIAAALDAVLDSREYYNPKTDRWASTENGSKLLIRDGAVIGGAGGKLNSSIAKKPFPKDGLGQVKAAQEIFNKSAKAPHTIKSFAKEAGISVDKARKLVNVFIAQGRLHDPTSNGRVEWSDDMKLHPDPRFLDSASEITDDASLAAALDAVDVPTASFDFPDVVEAQSIAMRVLAGETLDTADMSHALATLNNALDVVETNYPINIAEGNVEQAELEEKAAESFRSAMKILETQREPAAA